MNKKIAIAVGSAAAVAFTGAAFAADLEIINSSEGYGSPMMAGKFVPPFIAADCQANPSTLNITGWSGVTASTTLACNDHGDHILHSAATWDFFGNEDLVPQQDSNWGMGVNAAPPGSWGFAMIDPFGYGLGLADGDGVSYFNGLTDAWTNQLDAQNNPERAMGTPGGRLRMMGHESHREFWIDQTVVTYVQAWESLGGSDEFAQNFRSQLSWRGAVTDEAASHIDQRLEQSVGLGQAAFEASRQTLQSAFAVTSSGANTTTDVEVAEGDIDAGLAGDGIGQLVAQDIEGFFFSCMNCDSQDMVDSSVTHAFAPDPTTVWFQDYQSGWNVVPTVVHAP